MSSTAQSLKALHDLLLRLREVHDDLAAGPRQIQMRTVALQRRQAELTNARDRLKNSRATADGKNLQLKTSEAKIAELKNKLNIANSNREYEIINGQIAADTMAVSVLEDEILEALTKVDQLQVEVGQAEQAVQQAEAELANAKSQAAAREPGLQEREKSLQTAVTAAEKFLPGDLLPQYRRAVQAFGADALASVEDRVCQSCNVTLTSQKVVELRTGKLMFCSCGRLLYLPVATD